MSVEADLRNGGVPFIRLSVRVRPGGRDRYMGARLIMVHDNEREYRKDKMIKGIKENIKKRYVRHKNDISRIFFGGKDPGEIESAEITGDKHFHGDAVMRVETDRGYVFYYKPRDCRSAELLGRINASLFGKSMVPEQVTGDGYAFQKEVKMHLPESADEKAAFFEWIGRLTSVFYALGSTDMHNGNVICGDELPVVIDTETVLCAKAKGMGGSGEFSADYGEVFPDFAASVGECMVLPRFFGYMQTTPLIPGKGCGPYGYEGFFISGFEKGYLKIREKKDEISCILDDFEDIPLRYIMRSTAGYHMKIHLYKKAQNDEEREGVLKKLEKGISGKEIMRWRPIIDRERESIKEGDIPFFGITAGGRELLGGIEKETVIKEFLSVSPVDHAKWRMDRMSIADMKVQCSYIRASLRHIDGFVFEHADDRLNENSDTTIKKTDKQSMYKDRGQFSENAGSTQALKETVSENDENIEISGKDHVSDHVLTVADAVTEVSEMVGKLWDEMILLYDEPCIIWHTPMIRGRVGSMFGLAEGFSGTAVFARACAESGLLSGAIRDKAKEMSDGCFRSMVTFAEYILKEYPEKPEERIISRRFNGGFGLTDGMAGLLWGLKTCRKEDPAAADDIIGRFSSWNLTEDKNTERDVWNRLTGFPADGDTGHEKKTDIIDGGNAGYAINLVIASEDEQDAVILKKAGVYLKEIYDRRKAAGCYRLFTGSRRQYFLPAFLRGSTGIAYTMLRYAEDIFTFAG